MESFTKTLVTLSLGVALANTAVARNSYYDTSQWVDAKKYFNEENVEVYNEPMDARSNSWYATPYYVMSVNKKTKKPDILSVHLEGRGYSVEFEDLVVLNCAKPTESFIDRGDNGTITLKKSMAIDSYPGDANHNDHIARGAVVGLFKRYCK